MREEMTMAEGMTMIEMTTAEEMTMTGEILDTSITMSLAEDILILPDETTMMTVGSIQTTGTTMMTVGGIQKTEGGLLQEETLRHQDGDQTLWVAIGTGWKMACGT